jgi:hypothetical protein
MPVVAERYRVCEHLAIAAELHERGTDPSEPSQTRETDVSFMADQAEAFEATASAIEHDRATLPADPVLHAQLAAVYDAKRNAVAVHD